MKIYVPDMSVESAMGFCNTIDNYMITNDNECFEIDFSKVRNCDPFPMLMIANAIRRKMKMCSSHIFMPKNCFNDYARYMRFYSACGFDIDGKDVSILKSTSRYNCITRFDMDSLYNESRENLDYIQETLEKKAGEMARVLSQGNINFEKWMTFAIRELLRNIPEHSQASEFWYCSQYWPKYDLVEVAILDEGVGIFNSLSDSKEVSSLIKNDYDALKLALEPGVSGTFSSIRKSIGTGDWENSGYGLYMVSQMCAELGASFVIASGDSGIMVRKVGANIKQIKYDTCIKGTAIQIRIRPSQNVNYNKIRNDILDRGEKSARNKKYAVHSASKSSKVFL